FGGSAFIAGSDAGQKGSIVFVRHVWPPRGRSVPENSTPPRWLAAIHIEMGCRRARRKRHHLVSGRAKDDGRLTVVAAAAGFVGGWWGVASTPGSVLQQPVSLPCPHGKVSSTSAIATAASESAMSPRQGPGC